MRWPDAQRCDLACLLAGFKREFSFRDVLRLWEALWACPCTSHLHLYFAAAILLVHRQNILGSRSLDELLAFAVGLPRHLALQPSLRMAALLVHKAGPAGAEAVARVQPCTP